MAENRSSGSSRSQGKVIWNIVWGGRSRRKIERASTVRTFAWNGLWNVIAHSKGFSVKSSYSARIHSFATHFLPTTIYRSIGTVAMMGWDCTVGWMDGWIGGWMCGLSTIRRSLSMAGQWDAMRWDEMNKEETADEFGWIWRFQSVCDNCWWQCCNGSCLALV